MAYADEVLADSPISFWRLGEASGTTAADLQSVNAGTYVNSPTLGAASLLTGDANTAVTFNGTTHRITSGIVNFPTGTTDRTVEAWFSSTTTNDYNAILTYGDSVATRWFAVFLATVAGVDTIYISTYGTDINFGNGGVALTNGVRHHLAVTLSGTGTSVSVYIDGILLTGATNPQTITAVNTVNNANGARIGANNLGGGTADPFAGTLDEVAIYATALSSTRIAAHWTAGSTSSATAKTGSDTATGSDSSSLTTTTGYSAAVLTDSPAIYWRLGESSGVVATDVKGVNTGTYMNTPTLGVAGALTGETNTAVTLNGIDEYVSASNSGLPMGNANRSVELWFRTTTTADYNALFTYGTNALPQQFFGVFLTTVTAVPIVYISTAGGNYNFGNGSVNLVDGNWHHLVVTLGSVGTVLTVYVDGILLGGATNPQTIVQIDTVPRTNGARIGASNLGDIFDPFAGSIDEVAIYPTVLSASRVTAHYAARATAASTAYYTTDAALATETSITDTGISESGAGSETAYANTPGGSLAKTGSDTGTGTDGSSIRYEAGLTSTVVNSLTARKTRRRRDPRFR